MHFFLFTFLHFVIVFVVFCNFFLFTLTIFFIYTILTMVFNFSVFNRYQRMIASMLYLIHGNIFVLIRFGFDQLFFPIYFFKTKATTTTTTTKKNSTIFLLFVQRAIKNQIIKITNQESA